MQTPESPDGCILLAAQSRTAPELRAYPHSGDALFIHSLLHPFTHPSSSSDSRSARQVRSWPCSLRVHGPGCSSWSLTPFLSVVLVRVSAFPVLQSPSMELYENSQGPRAVQTTTTSQGQLWLPQQHRMNGSKPTHSPRCMVLSCLPFLQAKAQ